MFDFHQLNGACDFLGFLPVHIQRPAGFHAAETAAPGTYIPQNHKGSGTRAPAFTHIRAAAALANGVELIFIHKAAQFTVILSGGQLYANPFGFLCGGIEVVHNLEKYKFKQLHKKKVR